MKAILDSRIGSWTDVRDAARNTVWKNALESTEVSSKFKRGMLMSEHSPLRCLQFRITLWQIPYWVSVHLLRHHYAAPVFGEDPFITTQREDRLIQVTPRDELPQGALVNHQFLANAQAMVQVSRSRLCFLASKETIAAWSAVKSLLRREGESELADVMVMQCIYRGRCPEPTKCKQNFDKTPAFESAKERYWSDFERLCR